MERSLRRALRPRLVRLAQSLPVHARILDIGAKNAIYRPFFSQCSFRTLDIDPSHNPDIVADAHSLGDAIGADSYDLILCTEVIEHLHSPRRAIEEMRKVLKPGGVLLASTPFIVPYHPDPQDYWRLTVEAWGLLTREFAEVDVAWHGNQVLSIWYLAGMGYGMPLRLFDPIVFAAFSRLKGVGVYLGLICEARR
jgi:SAM-dependent methyltransferase